MHRTHFYFYTLLFGLLFNACTEQKAPLNVVVLFTDDQRFNTIRSLGNDEIYTPNLDKLVHIGVSFTHAHVMGSYHGAVCAPSRAMLLSGKPYTSIPDSFIDQGASPPDTHFDFTTFPELLRENGYNTFFTGKWHNHTSKIREGFENGENIFVGGMHWPRNGGHRKPQLWNYDQTGIYDQDDRWQASKFSSEMFSDAAVKFINEQNKHDPFCLYVAYSSPHDPREAPDYFAEMYDESTIRLPGNFMPAHPFDNGHLRTRDEQLAPFPRTKEIVKKEIAAYYAMISEVDAQIGRVLNALEEQEMLESTIIVFAGDNGLAVGQHGLMGKQNVYDHSVRVPLIFAAPGIKGDQRSDALCYLYDVFPTICDLLDLKIPESVEGKSLLPVLHNSNLNHRNHLILSHAKQMRAVRTNDNWKLINYFVKGELRQQLYNLNHDKDELNNLIDDPEHLEKKEELEDLLMKHLISKNDFVNAYIQIEQEHFSKPVTVKMTSSFPNVVLKYTLDGSDPDLTSPPYTEPIVLDYNASIRASQFIDNKRIGSIYRAEAKISKFVKNINTTPAPSPKYSGKGNLTLLDGENGSEVFQTGNWLGYEGENMTAVIELQTVQDISKVGVRYLSSPGSWIFPPKNIEISISNDGVNYSVVKSENVEKLSSESSATVIDYTIPIEQKSGKFIKYEIENIGTCPDWHLGKGQKAWLFLDELIVK